MKFQIEEPVSRDMVLFDRKSVTRQVKDIVFVPGLCGSSEDWAYLSDQLNMNPKIHTSFFYKLSGDRTIGHQSERLKRFIESSRNRPVFIAHSAGCLALVGAIDEKNASNVSGVILINPSPTRGINLPLRSLRRNLRWPYIWPLITGENVVPVSEDCDFLAGGASVTFAPDSPLVSAQIGGPFGFSTPRLCNLGCRTLIIQSYNDETIGGRARSKIRAYHNVRTRFVNGGHYPHCHPASQHIVAKIISNKLQEWGV